MRIIHKLLGKSIQAHILGAGMFSSSLAYVLAHVHPPPFCSLAVNKKWGGGGGGAVSLDQPVNPDKTVLIWSIRLALKIVVFSVDRLGELFGADCFCFFPSFSQDLSYHFYTFYTGKLHHRVLLTMSSFGPIPCYG